MKKLYLRQTLYGNRIDLACSFDRDLKMPTIETIASLGYEDCFILDHENIDRLISWLQSAKREMRKIISVKEALAEVEKG